MQPRCSIQKHTGIYEKMANQGQTHFQKCMLGKWTQSYDAVDRWIWPAITPREEMSTDEAVLAMITIFEELGMIEPTNYGTYTYVKGSENRLVFQYGDVLTIKKWYSLGYYLLRQITTIGKEDYVKLMMTVYNQFAKMQDYLHENIHRLQGIYKLYYGGFLQPIQSLIGSRRVKADPMKGSWGHQKKLILSRHTSLRRDFFLRHSWRTRVLISLMQTKS